VAVSNAISCLPTESLDEFFVFVIDLLDATLVKNSVAACTLAKNAFLVSFSDAL
jgi:hypothetical protein